MKQELIYRQRQHQRSLLPASAQRREGTGMRSIVELLMAMKWWGCRYFAKPCFRPTIFSANDSVAPLPTRRASEWTSACTHLLRSAAFLLTWRADQFADRRQCSLGRSAVGFNDPLSGLSHRFSSRPIVQATLDKSL